MEGSQSFAAGTVVNKSTAVPGTRRRGPVLALRTQYCNREGWTWMVRVRSVISAVLLQLTLFHPRAPVCRYDERLIRRSAQPCGTGGAVSCHARCGHGQHAHTRRRRRRWIWPKHDAGAHE